MDALLGKGETAPKTGKAFLESLDLKPEFAPPSMVFASDEAPNDAEEHSKNQANGKHDPAETPAPFTGFVSDVTAGAYSSDFHGLYESIAHKPESTTAQAADRYENLSRTAVPAALVCMTTLKQNGTTSAPFITVVSSPSAYNKGFTRRKLWKGPKGQPAKLEPGSIEGPTKTSDVTMGSLAQSTRSESAMQNNKRSPGGYIQRDTIICFSEERSMFLSVVASSQIAPGTRNTAFSDEHLNLRSATWASADAMQDVANDDDTWLDSAKQSGDETCVILSKWLPLPRPTFLPPGIVGATTLGVAGMRAICEHYLEADEETTHWLNEPITQEWFAAVATDPQAFSTHWLSRAWMRDSVTVTGASPEFQTSIDRNLWLDTERTLAFRTHLDYLRHRFAGSTGQKFERYLERAYDNLYTANSPTGPLPLELAGSLWYLRYPNVKRWDKSDMMNMAAWTTDDSVPPNVSLFLCHTVPATSKSAWIQPLLETKSEAEERLAEGDDALHTDTELAKSRKRTASTAVTAPATKAPPPVKEIVNIAAATPEPGKAVATKRTAGDQELYTTSDNDDDNCGAHQSRGAKAAKRNLRATRYDDDDDSLQLKPAAK